MVPVTSTLPVGKFDGWTSAAISGDQGCVIVFTASASTGSFASKAVVEFQRACAAAAAKREANKRKSQQRGAPGSCSAACRVRPQPERRPALTRPHQRGQGPR